MRRVRVQQGLHWLPRPRVFGDAQLSRRRTQLRLHARQDAKGAAPMRKLAVIPAIVSALLLAAHFLRADQLLLAAVCIALLCGLLIRRHWVTRLVQLSLLSGA